MSDNGNLKIEDKILELLDGELKERALGFADYLNINRLKPQQWFGPNFWRVPYKNKYLCGIVVEKNRWRFWFWKGDYIGIHEETYLKTIHDHVRSCISCGGDCPKGIDITVFGKNFKNTCFQFPVQFENPDNGTLGHIKKLMEYWKDVVPPDDAWHAHPWLQGSPRSGG